MMYIIHFICVFLPGKYKPLLEMKCAERCDLHVYSLVTNHAPECVFILTISIALVFK